MKDELNVKKIVFTRDASASRRTGSNPSSGRLVRKYGKLVPKIGEYLSAADGNELMERFNRTER